MDAAFLRQDDEKDEATNNHGGPAMALIERDAERMAAGLGDYSLVEVTAVVEAEPGGYEIEFMDLRFDLTYVIGSRFDYWDFLGYFVGHQMWPAPERHLSAA
jgi:hypothetical protein